MDPTEKRIIGISIALMASFAVGVLIVTFGFGITVPDCVTDQKPFTESALIKLDDTHYEFHCIARMWNYDKSEIVLPVGAELEIYLTSADVVHGFNIDKKAVNLMAVPGQVTVTSVTFDEPGTYPIVCHEYCGANHQSMKGTILIRPASDILADANVTASGNRRLSQKTGGEL